MHPLRELPALVLPGSNDWKSVHMFLRQFGQDRERNGCDEWDRTESDYAPAHIRSAQADQWKTITLDQQFGMGELMSDQPENIEVSEVIVRFSNPRIQSVKQPVIDVLERSGWRVLLLPVDFLMGVWIGCVEALAKDRRKPIRRVEIRIHR
jgi:hypothetical protein